jgi:putative endonuclease
MPDDNARSETGRAGEEAAARYLSNRGCIILARNWQAHPGEVDIIARCSQGRAAFRDLDSGYLGDNSIQPVLAFIEVRTRHGREGLAEESISRRKATNMAAAAFAYMRANGLDPNVTHWRIDLIAIAMSGDDLMGINWVQGAIGEEMVGEE